MASTLLQNYIVTALEGEMDMPSTKPFAFPMFTRFVVVFFGLAVVVFLVVLATTSGEVEVQMKPTVTWRNIETFISVGSGEETTGVLPAVFEKKVLEKQSAVESTQGKVKEQKAQVAITIHNQHSRDQTLVSTTRFLFNSTLYRLTQTVTVKAGTSVPAVVEAGEPGLGYERSKGDKLVIPGLWAGLQISIFAIAEEEVRSGTVVIQTVTQEHIEAAEKKVLEELQNEVESIKSEDANMLVFESFGQEEIVKPETEEAENPIVKATREVNFLRVSRQALGERLKMNIEAMEPDKKSTFSLDGVKVEVLDWKEDSARLHVTLMVGFFTPLGLEDFSLADFKGKDELSIRRLLQEKYGITEMAVNYSPQFLKPLLPRIGKVKLTLIEP